MEKGIAGCCSLLLAFFLVTCSDRGEGLSTNDFAVLYAEISHAQASATDSIAAVDSALAIAEKHGIDSLDLLEFRSRLYDHPEEWIRVWELIMQEIEKREESEKTPMVRPPPHDITLPDDSDSLAIKITAQ